MWLFITEAVQNRPLLFLLPFFITGLTLGPYLAPWRWLWPAAGVCGGLMAVAGFSGWRRFFGTGLVLVFVLIGAGMAGSVFSLPQDPRHVYQFRNLDGYVFEGRVVERPRSDGERAYVTVDLDGAERAGHVRTPVFGLVRLTVLGAVRLIGGERVRFPAELKEISGFANPGGSDYRAHMNGRGIWVSGFLKNPRLLLVVLENDRAFSPGRFMFRVRDSAARFLERMVRQPALGLIKAMLLGIQDDIEPEVEEAFRGLGLSHLMAISGLHVGLVALAAFWLFFHLLVLWPSLGRGLDLRRLATVLTFGPVLFYTVLAGGRPSTIRAFIMVAVFILAVVVERKKDPLTALATAAWIILIIQPAAVFLPSFQLSFAAVAAIIIINDRLNRSSLLEPTNKGNKYFSRRFTDLVLISTAALIGTGPITAYHFHQVALPALPANIVFTPLIGLAVVPPGLVALALGPVLPFFSQIIFFLMERFLWLILAVVETLASWPILDFLVPKPGPAFLLAYYLLAGALFLIRPWKKAAWAGGAVALVYGAVFLIFNPFTARELEVTFLDVGHGTAAAMFFPDRTTLTVDAGGFPRSEFDCGENIVAPFLLSRGLTTVDILVLSHPQIDHVGGLPFLARKFKPREFWSNMAPSYNRAHRELLKLVRQADLLQPTLSQLHRGRRFGTVTVRALWPPVDFLSANSRQELLDDQNNNSLVLKITLGQISFLLPGDLETRGEEDLVRFKGDELQADVLLASHHGGAASMTSGFLEKVRPKYIVFSVGRFNPHSPSAEVLSRAENTGAFVFRTDLDGAVTFRTDGAGLFVNTYRRK